MPPASTISAQDKAAIKQHLPSTTTKIHTATLARVYYAHPSPNEWSYSGIQGALAFVTDKVRGGFWWRVVDLHVSIFSACHFAETQGFCFGV